MDAGSVLWFARSPARQSIPEVPGRPLYPTHTGPAGPSGDTGQGAHRDQPL